MLQIYDLIVLGSGPGGQRAAVQAAKLKKRVLVIERDSIGGACLHLGTVPSKTLREAALDPEQTRDEDPLHAVMRRKESVIQAEARVIAGQLKRNGVEFMEGTGRFLSPHEIAIEHRDGKTSQAKGDYIVVATGTRPQRDPKAPFNLTSVFDSDTILRIPNLPRSLIILGAGVIGCEYASIFAKLGVKVTLMDRRLELLRAIDEEITTALDQYFRENGIKLMLGQFPEKAPIVGKTNGRETVKIEVARKELEADALLYCMGRIGNIESLDCAKAGIKPSPRGLIEVNDHYQTTTPHIYAVGDIIGAPALAASSAEQGRLASAHAFTGSKDKFPSSFPYGIYTIPEISTAGLQEADLKQQGIPYVAGRAPYKELARGKILDDDLGFLKLLVHKETHVILGVHVIGTGATELVHIGQVAMALGAKIEFLVNNVFNYPTLAEAYKVAAYNAFNQLTPTKS